MDYDNPEFLADMVELNYHSTSSFNDTAAQSIFARWFTGVGVYDTIRDLPNVPNMAVMASSQALVVLVGGVRDNVMRGSAIAGWSNRQAIEASRGFNAYAYDLYRRRLAPLARPYVGGSRPIIYVGHSMGSMVLGVANFERWLATGRWADLVLTTGGPRALSTLGDGTYGNSSYWRFMTVADPICWLPPRFSEAPYVMGAAVGLSFPVAVADFITTFNHPSNVDPTVLWPRFYHSPGGVALDSSFLGRPSETPLFNPWRAANGTIDNVLAGGIGSAEFHDISTYVSAVRNWALVATLPAKLKVWEPPIPAGVVFDEPPNVMLPVSPEGFYVLPLTDGDFFPMANPIQTGTMPSTQGPPQGCLYLRGEMVACFRTRGRARTVARKLNKFLASLPSATEVSVGGMSAGIASYLAEASVGGGVDKKPVRVVS